MSLAMLPHMVREAILAARHKDAPQEAVVSAKYQTLATALLPPERTIRTLPDKPHAAPAPTPARIPTPTPTPTQTPTIATAPLPMQPASSPTSTAAVRGGHPTTGLPPPPVASSPAPSPCSAGAGGQAVLPTNTLPPPMAPPAASSAPPAELVPLNFDSWPPPPDTLFLFHDTTGSVAHFRKLHPRLTTPCCAVQLTPGVPLHTFAGMVAHYARLVRQAQPTGALRLGGFSFGARTAFAVAQRLQRRQGRATAALVCVEDPPAFDLAYVNAPDAQRAKAMAANLFVPGEARAAVGAALAAQRDTAADAVRAALLPLVQSQPEDARTSLLSVLLAGAARSGAKQSKTSRGSGGTIGQDILAGMLRLLCAMSQDAFWKGYTQPHPRVGSGKPLPCGQVLLLRSTERHRAAFEAASEHELAPSPDDYGVGACVCSPRLDVVALDYSHQDMFSAGCAPLIAEAVDAHLEQSWTAADDSSSEDGE